MDYEALTNFYRELSAREMRDSIPQFKMWKLFVYVGVAGLLVGVQYLLTVWKYG